MQVEHEPVGVAAVVVVAGGEEDRDPQRLDVGEVGAGRLAEHELPEELGVATAGRVVVVLADVVVAVAR